MSCLPYGTRFYKGRISKTSKRGDGYINSSTIKVNDSLKSKVNLSQIVASVAEHFQTLIKIPFWKDFINKGGEDDMNHYHRPSWLHRLFWTFYWSRIIELACWGLLIIVFGYLGWLIIWTFIKVKIIWG